MPIADPDGPEVIEPRPKAERSIASLLSDLASETIPAVPAGNSAPQG